MTNYIMFRKNKIQLRSNRELLVNKIDGGTVSLDWYDFGVRFNDETPIIIFSHSLLGGSNEPYIKYLGKYAYETKGFRSVVFINRGCSGTPITSDIGGSGSRIDDFEMALEYIQQKYPKAPLFSVGHCIGSMVGRDGQTPITAYVCISPPVNVGMSSDSFTSTTFHKYFFYIELHKFMVKHYSKYGDRLKNFGCTIEDVKRAKSVREIDQLITTKMFGYKNVEEYYDDASNCTQHMEKLNKPMLIFNSKDDVMSPYQNLPIHKIKSNDNIILALTRRGGHLGFISRKNNWENWCHKAALEYLSTFVKKI
ncbi:alpha/beta hydrolase fold-1 domain-containing protein [Heterostelium album PN500]|uniref:Alpha/beta hydrolase fold-1 domain-containing protein n=1 Tax=Heterostelium pallidum (strain ATCC 26659 / Pp 5 / PN500) TaxID=670386 RepID=D3BEV3_HETP5|nr:alpha/beta hydrolase fold-1 domain-containing protein [Heterostelium album PN500]EFA80434.1 alpha/beta hydrolase fold-1 domain-containing protein [Heterostelium album PN500]|eukprot:XP_020432554.1 alpha/beta hydrolase fold-1 domain-containing protein [Heterostelium album PN500]